MTINKFGNMKIFRLKVSMVLLFEETTVAPRRNKINIKLTQSAVGFWLKAPDFCLKVLNSRQALCNQIERTAFVTVFAQ